MLTLNPFILTSIILTLFLPQACSNPTEFSGTSASRPSQRSTDIPNDKECDPEKEDCCAVDAESENPDEDLSCEVIPPKPEPQPPEPTCTKGDECTPDCTENCDMPPPPKQITCEQEGNCEVTCDPALSDCPDENLPEDKGCSEDCETTDDPKEPTTNTPETDTPETTEPEDGTDPCLNPEEDDFDDLQCPGQNQNQVHQNG